MQHSVREVELDNGAKGLVVHVPGVDVVRLLVEFRAGFNLNDWNKFELPHVMEHLMFTNHTYPEPNQFSREIEKNGAFNNAYTNDTSIEYDYECAAFEAERIAGLIAVQIAEPTFPKKEFTTEIGNVAEELKDYISNPMRSSGYNLCVAQEGAPTFEERIEQLGVMSTEDLQKWHSHTHTARNMRFIVAGDIDFDARVLPHLNVELPAGERLQIPEIPSKGVQEPVVENRDMPQIYYTINATVPRRFSYRECIAARTAANILSAGFTSTLLSKARERGLVYGLGMSVSREYHKTEWGFRGMVTPEHAGDYFDLAREEIGKVLDGNVSQEQFEATKQLMRGNRARNYQKVSDFLGYYDSFFTLGYTHFDEFDRMLEELTIEETVNCFKEIMDERCWGLSLLGAVDDESAQKYHQQLSKLWR